jgi:hypothetical protein
MEAKINPNKKKYIELSFMSATTWISRNLLIENLLSNFLCLQWKEKTLCTGKELSWGGAEKQ